MKPQYVLLQKEINPNLTILFKEVNQRHPEIISDGNGFAIIIEDWEEGNYRFVKEDNEYFTPKNVKPIKLMKDLNNLWEVLTGNPLTYIGKKVEQVKEGKVYKSNRGGNFTATERLHGNISKVVFEDGYTTTAQNTAILRGNVRNPYSPSVFGVGFIGEGKFDSTNNDIYKRWRGMLQRCYDENSRDIYKSYARAEVCEEWKCLQNFGTWYEEKYDLENMQDWALDKDLVIEGNKIYSPETCAFVPIPVNNIFVKIEGKNNGLPTGVQKKRGKYFPCFFKGGDVFHGRGYTTPEEASDIYLHEKRKYAKELAEKYKNFLDIRVYERLIQYSEKY